MSTTQTAAATGGAAASPPGAGSPARYNRSLVGDTWRRFRRHKLARRRGVRLPRDGRW